MATDITKHLIILPVVWARFFKARIRYSENSLVGPEYRFVTQ